MAEGCDCKSLFLACKHEEEEGVNSSQKSEEVIATVEAITVSENTKYENCNANETKDGGTMDSSNLTKVNSRSCPDLADVRPRSLAFGRLSKKLGRRKSWKIFRRSQEDSSDSDCKREEVRKRKESKTRKHNSEVNRNERQTSTSACGGVVGLFRLRSQSTETKGARTRRSRARRTSVFDKVMKLFESDSSEQESANATPAEKVLPSQSDSSSQDTRENSSSSLDTTRPLPPTDQEHLAFIEKVVREENLHFFDEETQRLWREKTSMECFLPSDILSVTNCPYYWGPINRYQAEKVSVNLRFPFICRRRLV